MWFRMISCGSCYNRKQYYKHIYYISCHFITVILPYWYGEGVMIWHFRHFHQSCFLVSTTPLGHKTIFNRAAIFSTLFLFVWGFQHYLSCGHSMQTTFYWPLNRSFKQIYTKKHFIFNKTAKTDTSRNKCIYWIHAWIISVKKLLAIINKFSFYRWSNHSWYYLCPSEIVGS